MSKLIVFFILVLVVGCITQFVKKDYRYRNDNDGRYYPSNEGQYAHDNSGQYANDNGQYRPDDSGKYAHDGSGSYDGINGRYNPDGTGRYKGQNEQYNYDKGQNNKYEQNTGHFGTKVGPNPFDGKGTSLHNPHTGKYDQSTFIKKGNALGKYDNRHYAILRQEQSTLEDGYHYLYETENGIYGKEQGKLENRGTNQEAMRARGYFTYTSPDNVIYTVSYTADENGFIPQGDHLPKAILRSLDYQRSHINL